MKPKIGIIGRGYWGSKVINYVDSYFDCVYYIGSKESDILALMEDNTVKNVMILTPIETHYGLCKLALNNYKNVFCEKPITLHTDQAFELKELAEANGLKLAVEYTFTFSKAINIVKDLTLKFGPVKYYEMNSKHLGRFMEHNVYWLLASHYLAVLDMFEDISKIEFIKRDRLFNGKVCTTGTLEFDKGRIETSLNYTGKDSTSTFYFDGATIRYNPTLLPPDSLVLTCYDYTYKALPPELINYSDSFNVDEQHNLANAIRYFYNLINNKAISNIDTAIKVTHILEDV